MFLEEKVGDEEDRFIDGAHFNEIKALFLFDRELRSLFLDYLLILENSIKTIMSSVFTSRHKSQNAYLDISNYDDDNPLSVVKQISILTRSISDECNQKIKGEDPFIIIYLNINLFPYGFW